jgi:hypothetical protein
MFRLVEDPFSQEIIAFFSRKLAFHRTLSDLPCIPRPPYGLGLIHSTNRPAPRVWLACGIPPQPSLCARQLEPPIHTPKSFGPTDMILKTGDIKNPCSSPRAKNLHLAYKRLVLSRESPMSCAAVHMPEGKAGGQCCAQPKLSLCLSYQMRQYDRPYSKSGTEICRMGANAACRIDESTQFTDHGGFWRLSPATQCPAAVCSPPRR